MKLGTIQDIEAELAKYIPLVKEITGKDITLVRMRPLMKAIGNPEKNLKIIHIAGTSGKTSTCYYVAALLREAGQKVGLTISPHVDSVTERIQIDLHPIDEATFGNAFSDFLEVIESVEPRPTYFELLIAFVYWYFAKVGVDYAVIETGLGGLHDATNVANSSDKVCVITDIGYDHMHVLGNTLSAITTQKAGIIYPENDVLCYQQSDEVNAVIEQAVLRQKAHLHVIEVSDGTASSDLPLFQQRNWHLAKAVYDLVASRDNLPQLNEQQQIASTQVVVPARMETIHHGKQLIILDGSHNAQKIGALVDSVLAKYPNKSVAILTSLVRSKQQQIVHNVKQLRRLDGTMIITSFSGSQDIPHTSVSPNLVAVEAEKQGIEARIVEPPEQAFNELLKKDEDILLVTGSFYLLNHIRPLVRKLK